jgi:hypothetical protein
MSTAIVRAQIPEIGPPENARINITMELLPDARSHVTANVEARFKVGVLPITSGNLSISVSSSGSRQLQFNVSGDVTFTEERLAELPEEERTILSTINADIINAYIAQFELEGENLSGALSKIPGLGPVELPPEAADIKIEKIYFNKFSWKNLKIEAGLTTTISGSEFENKFDLSLDIHVTGEDNTMEINLTFDGYFDLPRVGNTVQWNLQTPKMENIPELENFNLENLGELLKQYDVNFTLKVPSGASVSGLPPGYSQNGDNYVWSGDNAANALDLVLTGEPQSNITYGYKPSAGFPCLVVGVLIAVFVVAGVTVVVIKRI